MMIWIYNCVCPIHDLGVPESHMLVNLLSPCFFYFSQHSSIIITSLFFLYFESEGSSFQPPLSRFFCLSYIINLSVDAYGCRVGWTRQRLGAIYGQLN